MSIIEIDLDVCSRSYGVAPCVAALSASNVRKCFNTWRTCQDRSNFVKSTKTLRFCEPRTNYPRGLTVFPVVLDVEEETSQVNIAGSDERLSAFGDRAEISVTLTDFIHHDRGLDPYVAGRKDGTAQIDESGYDPQTRGTFFLKLHARNPFYYSRPMRRVFGYLDGGVFTPVSTRNYIIREIGLPNEDGILTIRGQDIMGLASDEKALVPMVSEGFLSADITDVAVTATLTPAGIGDLMYPASGRATIGSEVVGFTRVGDVCALSRGLVNTKSSAHKAGDTFQLDFAVSGMRVDDFVYLLLNTYAKIPSSFLPKTTKWAPEVDFWAAGLRIYTDVVKPTGVAKIIGELAALGLIIFWDDELQEVGLKLNRPVMNDTVHTLSDDSILEIVPDKKDDDRLSQVVFYTVQRDPTKSLTDWSNYDVVLNRIDPDAQGPREYAVPKIRNIPIRFFNNGADTAVSVLATRLLTRFRDPPTTYRILINKRDDTDIKLGDVLEVTTDQIVDVTGKSLTALLQVFKKKHIRSADQVELHAQVFYYSGRYGFITDNSRPAYNSSSNAQKKIGAYFSNAGAAFLDGGPAYRFI